MGNIKTKGLLVGLAIIIGGFFKYNQIPIPWTLGGIFSALILQIAQVEDVSWNRDWRNGALLVVGYGTGRYVDGAMVKEMVRQGPGIVSATLVAVLVCVMISVLMTKYQHLDLHSVLMGIMPGGFTQMTAMLDDDKRVDANIVTVYQSLRLIIIVVSVPLMVVHLLGANLSGNAASLAFHEGISFWLILPFAFIGGRIFRKIGTATPELLGSIVVAAVASLCFGRLDTPPSWLLAFAQINIGMYVGTGLNLNKLKALLKTLPAVIMGILFLLLVSIGFAHFLSSYYGFSLITAFLAMAPGGLAEMCLTGMSIGENVAIILTYQLFRFLFLNLAVPFAMKKYFGPPVK